jgi:hypothetical protein
VFEVALKILVRGTEQRIAKDIADDLTETENTEAMSDG